MKYYDVNTREIFPGGGELIQNMKLRRWISPLAHLKSVQHSK